MKVIFMGTPEFAVSALKKLHGDGHEIVLAVTQPDRPRGRGRQVSASPVKKAAMGLNIPVSQPESIRTVEFLRFVQELQPDVLVVVAFGQILPKSLLSVPPVGSINIHASLLPKYRGPAPIQWAIINEEKQTGVTIMFMDEGLDTGDILLAQKTDISPDDTTASLYGRLAEMGAELISDTLGRLSAGHIKPVRQDHEQATYAPLLKKSDGLIDWTRPAYSLDAFIRGMSPWPGAFTFYDGRRLKIFRAVPARSDVREAPGTVIPGFPDELRVMTGEGALSILDIQGASGKRLPIRDFLQGNSIPPGTKLKAS
ncbi:MAG: methionyl-tRNA formyltransferase [Desulfobacterales bacterium]|nr:methionyl-tRNA formyltransferase [Desulfobacterales bacterium]